jgi:predicted enzyme involved in methoxymalonyl-ACP biosynthesis
MSCRVISRRLEEFVLDQLVEVAREHSLDTLRGRYVPTQKNGLVAKHYERLGFDLAETFPDGGTSWRLDLHDYVGSDAPIARRELIEQ